MDKTIEPHWFSRGYQKQYVYKIAERFYIEYDYTAEEAIDKAQHFIDTFYAMKIDPQTRRD